MRLRDYLQEDLVAHGVRARDTAEAMDAFGHLLAHADRHLPAKEATKALLAREASHTTAIGEGVAVPHAVLPGLEEIRLLVVLTSEPVDFGVPEPDRPDLFFVLLSPPGREKEHIKLLGRICRLLRHPGVMDELRSAANASELFQTLIRVDSEHV